MFQCYISSVAGSLTFANGILDGNIKWTIPFGM